MKITHISLNAPVTDGWTYQDNILPKYHQKLGYEVSLIVSKYVRDREKAELKIDPRDSYINEDEVKVIRLKNRFKTTVKSKFKIYSNLYNVINTEEPDILFIHGVQFLNIFDIIKYLKKNPHVTAYVDNHADFGNSASNLLSRAILHGVIWRLCAHKINPFVRKFYGVLPARVDFLIDIYKLPENKVELLLMGSDDEIVEKVKYKNIKYSLRKKHQVEDDDFLIVTGGKIDRGKKQTLLLMKAVKQIENPRLKLIVFGSVEESLQKELESLIDGEKVKYIGWVEGIESYKYFNAANLVIFPGSHSVFWEQVAGLGIPMIVKHWNGANHVDVGGNCDFLYDDSVEEIKRKILDVINNKQKYNKMKSIAEKKGKDVFSYYTIAKESIEN